MEIEALLPYWGGDLPLYRKGGIHIKESRKGTLHKALGIPEGDKIPASMLKERPGDSPALRKKKNFARAARKWKHFEGGLLMSEEEFRLREILRELKEREDEKS
jgi:hypothetical protein